MDSSGWPRRTVNFFVKQADNYQYLLNIAQEVSDQKEAFTAFKSSIFEGDPTKLAPTPPVFPTVNLPQTPFNGMEAEAKAIIKRIKSSAGYNQTIGEQLGLVDTGGQGFNPNDLVAALSFQSKPGSIVEIAFSKQGQDGMRVEFKRKGDAGWSLAGVFLTSPGTHAVPSIPADEPESREYRGVLIKKNDAIGNFSPTYTVVTIP